MRQNKKAAICCRLLLLICGLYGARAFALESDSEQPIIIDSNTATYDDKAAISTYTGNVISVQGSIRVNSDKLVVYFKDGEADKLVFTGKRAKFKQTPSEGAEDITGEALTGEYYPKKNLLILIDEATVWQGNGTYSSKLIEYDIKTSLVKAGEKLSDSKRVHVILKPKSKESSQ
ncbi:MAG: lipopolysaccharide transport periplasmic protein LptA [Methylobacter sp.]|jgi:lipopolysaccharide export system protein LptA